jgi:uncharacterized glyoxalase superfamily protein PhnB
MNSNAQIPPGSPQRANPQTFRGRELSVSLTVQDLQKSLAWYRDVVGFWVASTHERDGAVMAVSLKAGTVRILITQDDGGKGASRAKGEGFSLYIATVQNVDELAARIKERGGILDMEPTNTPWGARVFRLRDPDGFRIAIAAEASD